MIGPKKSGGKNASINNNNQDFLGDSVIKNLPASAREGRFNPWVRKIFWIKRWHSTPVFLPGKSYGQRSLAGYSPCGHKESETAEPLSMHLNSCLKALIKLDWENSLKLRFV